MAIDLVLLNEIADCSRKVMKGNPEDLDDNEFELCYLIEALCWGQDQLYARQTYQRMRRARPEMLQPVVSEQPHRVCGVDVGYALGITSVWPLRPEPFDKLVEDPNYSWRDMDLDCLVDGETSLDVYIFDCINLHGFLERHLPAATARSSRSDAAVGVLTHLAQHVGSFLPPFRLPSAEYPPRIGEAFPRIAALIWEDGQPGRAANVPSRRKARRQQVQGATVDNDGELTDGQELVRLFGMRYRTVGYDGWSKYWIDFNQLDGFIVSEEQWRCANKMAEWSGKCIL